MKELEKFHFEGGNAVEVRKMDLFYGDFQALKNINMTMPEKQITAMIGPSGCGKSTLGRTILHLIEPTSGKIIFDGRDISDPDRQTMTYLRENMQIIFQDPFASLNPRMTVSEAIMEPLLIQKIYDKKDKEGLQKRVHELMNLVGLAERLTNSYPHELDGGRRQRIGIARALALRPKFIVCDEPVSALDVSIQAQILNLMQDLQDELDLTYMFITHDLSVVKHFSNQIMVMYLGQMVEMAPTEVLFKNPVHPYTKALLSAIPIPDPDYPMERIMMKGEITSPIDPEPGCRFAKRCPYATEVCGSPDIHLTEVEPGHFVSCMRIGEFGK